MDFSTSKTSVSPSPNRKIRMAGILVGLLVILGVIGIHTLLKPKEMTLQQFLEAKKNHRSGGFIIEGIVEEYNQERTAVVFQDNRGKDLSTLQIGSNGVMAYVSYYPNQLPDEVHTGDSVRITGSFTTVPYYGGHPGKRNQKMTTAMLSSIKIIRNAPVSEDE